MFTYDFLMEQGKALASIEIPTQKRKHAETLENIRDILHELHKVPYFAYGGDSAINEYTESVNALYKITTGKKMHDIGRFAQRCILGEIRDYMNDISSGEIANDIL